MEYFEQKFWDQILALLLIDWMWAASLTDMLGRSHLCHRLLDRELLVGVRREGCKPEAW